MVAKVQGFHPLFHESDLAPLFHPLSALSLKETPILGCKWCLEMSGKSFFGLYFGDMRGREPDLSSVHAGCYWQTVTKQWGGGRLFSASAEVFFTKTTVTRKQKVKKSFRRLAMSRWWPVGWLVGGCGARAVSRRTPIYFM